MFSFKTTPSSTPSSTPSAIDSNQLLTLCQRIRENMDTMEKGIKMAQFRLRTLGYVQLSAKNDYDIENTSLKCLDELLELCNLSRLLIKLLDELHTKLIESQENSIDYQIASQQLMFFTSEWYDNLTPKLNETFELASKQDIDAATNQTYASPRQQSQQVKSELESRVTNPMSSTDGRVRDALLRLRQSMGENARLIGVIANNIDYTRTAIEAIYDSLQSTKFSLDAGQENALGALKQLRENNRQRLICLLILIIFLLLICLSFFYFLSSIFN